jgi:hypothetical protein
METAMTIAATAPAPMATLPLGLLMNPFFSVLILNSSFESGRLT